MVRKNVCDILWFASLIELLKESSKQKAAKLQWRPMESNGSPVPIHRSIHPYLHFTWTGLSSFLRSYVSPAHSSLYSHHSLYYSLEIKTRTLNSFAMLDDSDDEQPQQNKTSSNKTNTKTNTKAQPAKNISPAATGGSGAAAKNNNKPNRYVKSYVLRMTCGMWHVLWMCYVLGATLHRLIILI